MIKLFILSLLLLSILLLIHTQNSDTLKCGETLTVNQFLQSGNCYSAVVQGDCNLVVYSSKHFVPRNIIFSTQISRNPCTDPKLVNQNDGNLVFYDGNTALWSSDTTEQGTPCNNLLIQGDGNLVYFTNDDPPIPLWATGSGA